MEFYVVNKKDKSKFVCFNDTVGYHLSKTPELMDLKEAEGCLESLEFSNFYEDENIILGDLEISKIKLEFI